MSTRETVKVLNQRLAKLNKVIDLKIYTRKDWAKEMREHTQICAALNQMKGTK